MSFQLPYDPTPEAAAVLEYIAAVNNHQWDVASHFLSDDFTHNILPPTLNRPSRSKTELLMTQRRYAALVPDMKVTVNKLMEAPGRVWVYAESTGKPTMMQDTYTNTYIFMFDLVNSPDGVQITHFDEFVDSAFLNDFMKKVEGAIQGRN